MKRILLVALWIFALLWALFNVHIAFADYFPIENKTFAAVLFAAPMPLLALAITWFAMPSRDANGDRSRSRWSAFLESLSPRGGRSKFPDRVFTWFALRFTRHEIWALNMALRYPFFGLFAVVALCVVWFLLPSIPVGAIAVYLLLNAETAGIVFNVVLSIVFGSAALALFMPWLLRWYLICAGLMFGSKKMAQTKADELVERHARLVSGSAPSSGSRKET